MGSPFGLTWHRLGTICEQGISWGESSWQIISETASQTGMRFRRASQRANRTNRPDRKSTRLNSSHRCISYVVFCLKKKNSLSGTNRFVTNCNYLNAELKTSILSRDFQSVLGSFDPCVSHRAAFEQVGHSDVLHLHS